MTTTDTATVITLTAEVRTLVVGTRQITLSVYKQLDCVLATSIEPMGRVHAGIKVDTGYGYSDVPALELVGCSRRTGTLVRSYIDNANVPPRTWKAYHDWPGYDASDEARAAREHARDEWRAFTQDMRRLPLIVLAGLK